MCIGCQMCKTVHLFVFVGNCTYLSMILLDFGWGFPIESGMCHTLLMYAPVPTPPSPLYAYYHVCEQKGDCRTKGKNANDAVESIDLNWTNGTYTLLPLVTHVR